MSYTIRTATTADAPSVLKLWSAVDNPSATDTERALNGLLTRDPDSLLLAEDNSEIIGSLIVGWDGWRGSFYRLAVHPGRRRQGLATALVRAGEQKLAEMGAVRLTAIVANDEHAALELWESVGYDRDANTNRFVRMLID